LSTKCLCSDKIDRRWKNLNQVSVSVTVGSNFPICQVGGGIMESESLEKAKKCCSKEHDRLMSNLSHCDSQFETPAEKHRCYRVAAKRSGRRSKKCMISE